MGTIDGPADADCRKLNERIRRIGVGATVELSYPTAYDDVGRQGVVVARDRAPEWLSRSLREHERGLLLERDPDDYVFLVGYEPWHARSVPVLYRRRAEGVPVLSVSVRNRGIQVDAARSAAELYDEVGRFGGP